MLGTILQAGTQVKFDSVAISLTDKLVSFSTGIADGFRAVGVGIASIMLLIVALYYVSSILDGGKFQLKMLVPLAIFFIVCNFSWISRPVVLFTTTITESLTRSLYDMETSIKNKSGLTGEATTGDIYLKSKSPKEGEEEIHEDAYLQLTGQAGESLAEKGEREEGKSPEISDDSKGRGGVITRSIDKAKNKIVSDTVSEFSSTEKDDIPKSPVNTFFTTLLCMIFGSICKAMSYVFKAFGSMMSAIIIALGPITFAFAIMPGQGGTVKTWFIRLCQFSLYSPLCALINCFTTFLVDFMMNEGGGLGGFAMCLGLQICSLVALTSIPTIASMVIEGASGAVSLSQGLQSISQTAGNIGGMVMAATVGKDNKMSNFLQGAQEMGAAGLIRSYREGAATGGSSGGFSNMMNEATSRGYSQQHFGMERGNEGTPSGQNNS